MRTLWFLLSLTYDEGLVGTQPKRQEIIKKVRNKNL